MAQSTAESEFHEAFEEYTDIINKSNRDAVTRLIQASMDDEKVAEMREDNDSEGSNDDYNAGDDLEDARLGWIIDLLGIESKLVKEPQDILKNWDTLAPIAGLNGSTIEKKDSKGREQWRLGYIHGLRESLQALGGEAAQIDLPEDFLILLRHADTLVGHKWAKEREDGRQITVFTGMLPRASARSAIEGPDALKGAPAYAWGDKYSDFESVVAGFQTGEAPEGSCYCICGRQRGSGEGNKWYYHINEGQFGTKVFASIIDLLEWYQGYNLPEDNDIEESLATIMDFA